MDPLVVISPHLDDAVLSCGQMMAGRPDCVVISVFAAPPARWRMLTTYDRDSGFSSAGQALIRRRAEDAAALNMLAARPIYGPWLDNQYREPDTYDDLDAWLGDWLVRELGEFPSGTPVVGPLGLVHPDHHATSRAVEFALRQRPDLEGWVYEDLPSRVLWPEEVPGRLAWWEGMGWTMEQGFLGTGDIEAKEAAVRAYASQTWALDMHAVLCPERLWRLTRWSD